MNFLKHKKQYPCSALSLFVVLHETRYDQHNYFWYYRNFIIDPFTLIGMLFGVISYKVLSSKFIIVFISKYISAIHLNIQPH